MWVMIMAEGTGRMEAELLAAGWQQMEDAGFIALVGPIWLAPERPLRRYGFIAEAKHKNRGGVVQGGMLMTFADRAMGATSRETDPSIASQATAQLNFDFIDAANIGDFIEIDCEVMRHTKSLVFLRATLSCGDRLIGTASGIWKVKKRGA
jgi:acyl-coenzyme A thioesterase PaaI-like protein